MFKETLQSKRAVFSVVLGTVLVIIGALGFINDPVFGLFQVDRILNSLHIISGLFLVIYGGQNFFNAKKTAVIIGVFYSALAILGFVAIHGEHDKLFGLMEMNPSDSFLHLFFAFLFLSEGLL